MEIIKVCKQKLVKIEYFLKFVYEPKWFNLIQVTDVTSVFGEIKYLQLN